MIFTVDERENASNQRRIRRSLHISLVFRFQTCSAAECPKLPEGAAMISYGAADTFAQGLIPDFSVKGKDVGDPLYLVFRWGTHQQSSLYTCPLFVENCEI